MGCLWHVILKYKLPYALHCVVRILSQWRAEKIYCYFSPSQSIEARKWAVFGLKLKWKLVWLRTWSVGQLFNEIRLFLSKSKLCGCRNRKSCQSLYFNVSQQLSEKAKVCLFETSKTAEFSRILFALIVLYILHYLHNFCQPVCRRFEAIEKVGFAILLRCWAARNGLNSPVHILALGYFEGLSIPHANSDQARSEKSDFLNWLSKAFQNLTIYFERSTTSHWKSSLKW